MRAPGRPAPAAPAAPPVLLHRRRRSARDRTARRRSGARNRRARGRRHPVTSPAELVAQRHVVICCGTGGVGKTTTAATLAIEGARRGRDAVVVTIDPAKRLANTLGIEHLSKTAHEIPRARWEPDRNAPKTRRPHPLTPATQT